MYHNWLFTQSVRHFRCTAYYKYVGRSITSHSITVPLCKSMPLGRILGALWRHATYHKYGLHVHIYSLVHNQQKVVSQSQTLSHFLCASLAPQLRLYKQMAKSTCSAAAYINCRQEGIIVTPPSVTLSDPWSATTLITRYQLTTPTMKATSHDANRLWSSAYISIRSV